MNIKCPECGHENQLGAIFCRNCGSKLDINTFHPEVKERKAGGGFGGIAKRLAGAIVVLAALAGLVAATLPMGLRKYEEPAQETKNTGKAKFEALFQRIEYGRGKPSVSFTPAELTALANEALTAKPQEGAETPAPPPGATDAKLQHIIVDVTASGDLSFSFDVLLYGKIPMRFEISGRPTTTETDNGAEIGFDIKSASMGHLPIPTDALKAKFAEKFSSMTEAGDLGKALKALGGLEVDAEGNIVATVATTKPKQPKK